MTIVTTLDPVARDDRTPRVDAATRREFLALVGALAALSACGGDDDGEAAAGDTRTVPSSHGPIEIPVVPRRVVAMHDQLVGYAVASLGFEDLIAVAARDAADPAIAIRQFGDVPAGFEGLEDIGTYGTPNVEAIARLEPDLIIGLPYEVDPLYEQLSAIAPTVVVDLVEGARPRFQRQRDLAAVVGVEGEMDERLDDYGARLEAVRATIDDTLTGAAYTYIESFGSGAEDNWVIRSDHAPGLMVLADLGMTPSSTTTHFVEEYNGVSLELLADYDADVIFVCIPEDSELDPRITTLLDSTVAGLAGNVFTVSRDIWSLEVVEALFASITDIEEFFAERRVVASGQFTS
jgi:iron complex transport system substrate-binding protein